MKKYFKIIMSASFIFLMAFGVSAQTTYAATTVYVTYDGNGGCTLRTVMILPDGKIIYDYSERGKVSEDGSCVLKDCHDVTIDPRNVDNMFGDKNPVLGNKNSYAVKNIQAMLLNENIPVVVDGNFGPRTQQGIKTFQRQNNLAVTGIFDLDTRRLMQEKLSSCLADNPIQIENAPTENIISLMETTSKIDNLKKEIESISKLLTSLTQQASVLSAFKN